MFFKKTTGVRWMIVGLGNPGEEYQRSRHNVGFRAVELLAKQAGVKIDRAKCRAFVRQCEMAGEKVLLVKPQTYMNNSGEAVWLLSQYYKIPQQRIVVLSDDISLPVGRVRVRGEGSAGGHNGLKSIIQHLGSQDFPRVKIGVGQKPHPDYDLASWVLSSFTAEEEKSLEPAIEHAAAAAVEILKNGVSSAANKYNGKTE